MWYVIEKWPGTDPVFCCAEDGEVVSFETKDKADDYAEGVNYPTVVNLGD